MGGTFFYSNRQGSYENQDLSAETFGFRGRVSLNLTLWKKLKIQSGVNYSSPMQTPQGRSLAFSMWQAGASIDLFKKNATLALNVNDILNTGRWRWQVETPTLATNGMFQWQQRNATMTFTYRFNQQGERYSGRLCRRYGYGYGILDYARNHKATNPSSAICNDVLMVATSLSSLLAMSSNRS